jgi:hypothetical protein
MIGHRHGNEMETFAHVETEEPAVALPDLWEVPDALAVEILFPPMSIGG